jgi:hypothetical protein
LGRFDVFFRGISEKTGVWRWFFDGENVVKCVVYRGVLTAVFPRQKLATFQRYFFGPKGIFPKMGNVSGRRGL